MEYSAVTQPRPLPWRKRGTVSSSQIVHSTRVRPIEQSTLARGFSVKSTSKETGRSSSSRRPSLRSTSFSSSSGRAWTLPTLIAFDLGSDPGRPR